LAVRMVADVTETRNVIPGLEFKTWMTIKSKFLPFWAFLNLNKLIAKMLH